MIEVCFCVYQRHARVPDLLQQLANQTFQDFKVNIWNNSGQNLAVDNFPADRLQVVDKGYNFGSQARFRLVPLTKGNPIIFIDDDEELELDFIEYMFAQYQRYGTKYILGWFTRIFHQENYWHSTPYSKNGTPVDYVGTGGMILDREIFDKEPLLQNISEEYNKVEDLYLSYLARTKYNMELMAVDKKCKIIVDGSDQFKQLTNYKQNAFQLLRNSGWRLLKD
ncbi:glycosyltransferase [Candidatus Parcubacteria bacterium]|nr:glycosyltransferase [Candidatus Parcubacteria bacterium]